MKTRNIIGIGVLGACLTLDTPIAITKPHLIVPEEQVLRNNNIKYTLTDHLTLNADSTKTLVTITTEKEAIKDMRYLCQKNVNEESWIQVPLKNDSRYMFVEVGKYSEVYIQNKMIYTQGVSNVDLIFKIREDIDSLVFWHYHPDRKLLMAAVTTLETHRKNSAAPIAKPKKTDPTLSQASTFIITLSNANNYRLSLPSSVDLNFAKKRSLLENDEHILCINNRIASSSGISDFSITPYGRALAKEGKLKDFIGKKYRMLDSKNRLRFNGKYFNINYDKYTVSKDTLGDYQRELLFNKYAGPYLPK